ncbi:Hypothetical predicted protein [Mytilus galloprovincialis]|uniref:Uncharacterized protein n=1 Tax=Mytilus galloprovincialis TaxID=29158 RepID=A0A8B6G276_MYTGA|nr:Hypothetical predicted protein [Mytilus galloprovincialis]
MVMVSRENLPQLEKILIADTKLNCNRVEAWNAVKVYINGKLCRSETSTAPTISNHEKDNVHDETTSTGSNAEIEDHDQTTSVSICTTISSFVKDDETTMTNLNVLIFMILASLSFLMILTTLIVVCVKRLKRNRKTATNLPRHITDLPLNPTVPLESVEFFNIKKTTVKKNE